MTTTRRVREREDDRVRKIQQQKSGFDSNSYAYKAAAAVVVCSA